LNDCLTTLQQQLQYKVVRDNIYMSINHNSKAHYASEIITICKFQISTLIVIVHLILIILD